MMYLSTTQATVQIKEGLAGRPRRREAQRRPTRVETETISVPSIGTAARRAAVAQPAMIMKLMVR